MNRNPIQVETVIVGGGQCGLSTGYYLSRAQRSFVILDENDRVGDGWRRRYDSLRLYTPRQVNRLPGMSMDPEVGRFPTGRQMGDFLESYASRMNLPVVHGAKVDDARRLEDGTQGFVVRAGDRTYEASNLVVAAGSQRTPQLPAFASQLDTGIRQLHSDDYRNTGQLNPGGVLIVGAAHSGADLAMECAEAGHHTWLCGPDRGQLPMALEGRTARAMRPLLWFAANHVLTMRTPMGRGMREEVRSTGGPLLRYRRSDLAEAGIERIEDKVTGVRDGLPAFADGTTVDPANVIWCTGYSTDFSWLHVDYPTGDDGWPVEDRGVVSDVPGLYFMGLLFQYAFASMLIGGAGRDAKHVARHILRSPAGAATQTKSERAASASG